MRFYNSIRSIFLKGIPFFLIFAIHFNRNKHNRNKHNRITTTDYQESNVINKPSNFMVLKSLLVLNLPFFTFFYFTKMHPNPQNYHTLKYFLEINKALFHCFRQKRYT